MSPNENNFVPKFERELRQAGGNLSALKEEKKKEAAAADDIDMEIDLSSLRSAPPDEQADVNAPEIEVEEIPAPTQSESAAGEEDIDFVYGEDDSYNYTGSLDAISADSIALDDMDSNVNVKVEEMRTDKSSIISSLKNQMQEDDLAMSVTNRPKLDDMSDEYAPIRKTAAEVASKEQLDRDEKELIKNRLKTEIESKPEGYDKKKSLAMYKKLMEEQKAKAAKKGFIQLLVTAALGLVTAVPVYFIEPGGEASSILDYLPMGALVFALFMLIKSKFSKILSALYFLAETVLLIYPGLVGYLSDTNNQASGTEFMIKLAMYAIAALLSALTFIRLAGNKDIEAYYSYKPGSSSENRHR